MLHLIIETETGKKLRVEVSETANVDKLVEVACDENGSAKEESVLFFKERELQCGKALSDYGITDGATIILKVATRGRMFKAPDVSKSETKKTGKNNLLYWYLDKGLNYGGKCRNKECKAHEQNVMFHRGFGKIDPSDDEHIDEIVRCPGCKKVFEVEANFFFQCQVEIVYKKSGDEGVTRLPVKRVVGDDYWKLGEEGGEKSNYTALKLVVSPLE
ncbi:hypothetical protein RFI_13282 [Reticulomyxa filosa]|uniref:Ubiquitin-like domain-containing protein n=1 Tax=Reticulomyxa filosa TaxID=46433 RepID=X6NEY2_RETFI|nr:hypothetical protein RFI_13282 [Reticulomyxa filosa]|eukprot:ETO23877.1 hypothetical protein RFI_13282 [Reticulomyxa filosa]